MKTALISGGCGFIGSHIAEALVKQGVRVIIIDNMAAGKMENVRDWWDSSLCTLHHADVSQYSAIEQHFLGVDVVFHNAASKCTVCTQDPVKDLMVNALGTLNVCQAAYNCGVKKVIHASTGSVNQINSYYGNSKNAGENYLRTFRNYHPGFNFTALRYHHVYGPRQDWSDKGGVIPIFIRQALTGKPITVFGDGNQVRFFTHVYDVVKANLFCAENEDTDGKTFNLLQDTGFRIGDLAEMVQEMTGRNVGVERLPEKAGDIRNFVCERTAIEEAGFMFDWPFERGLMDTIRWYERRLSVAERNVA